MDSEHSWTVDLTARKAKAHDEAEPLRRQGRAKEQEAAAWRERLAELKKASPRDEKAVEEAERRVAAALRAAREFNGQAEDVTSAVYDLKAVNPNAKSEEDTRTPEELLDLIEAKGREIAEALGVLRGAKGVGPCN